MRTSHPDYRYDHFSRIHRTNLSYNPCAIFLQNNDSIGQTDTGSKLVGHVNIKTPDSAGTLITLSTIYGIISKRQVPSLTDSQIFRSSAQRIRSALATRPKSLRNSLNRLSRLGASRYIWQSEWVIRRDRRGSKWSNWPNLRCVQHICDKGCAEMLNVI